MLCYRTVQFNSLLDKYQAVVDGFADREVSAAMVLLLCCGIFFKASFASVLTQLINQVCYHG